MDLNLAYLAKSNLIKTDQFHFSTNHDLYLSDDERVYS